MQMPKICKKCKHVNSRTLMPFARDPHYCWELIWWLHKEDHQVDPDKVDNDYCPLRNNHIQVYLEENEVFE